MERPIVALLTDFGIQDPYVGAVKGAVLSLCRDATLVDLSHDIPPQDIVAAALCLESVYGFFPAGTVFLAIVDPGVGSSRRALAARAGARSLVGPDNGVLSLVLNAHADAEVREIAADGLVAHQVSPTFHGRDVFGPVAARLAGGLALDAVGPRIGDYVRVSLPGVTALGPDEWEGCVIHVDRFGNLTTNFRECDLRAMRDACAADVTPSVCLGDARLPLVRTYSDVPAGEPCALMGSAGRLEVAVRDGSAALRFVATRGTTVRVRHAHPPRP